MKAYSWYTLVFVIVAVLLATTFYLSQPVIADTEHYDTYDLERNPDGSVTLTLFPGKFFDEGGTRQDFSDVVDMSWDTDALKIYYYEGSLRLKPYIKVSGVKYYVGVLPGDTDFNLPIEKYNRKYKFSLRVSNIPPGIKDDVESFGFEIVDSNLTGGEIKENDVLALNDRIDVSFKDISDMGYTVNAISSTEIEITGLDGQTSYDLDPELTPADGNTYDIEDSTWITVGNYTNVQFVMAASNIYLDCQSSTFHETGSSDLNFLTDKDHPNPSYHNFSVRNCWTDNYKTAIDFTNTTNGVIKNFTIHNGYRASGGFQIALNDDCDNYTIRDSTVYYGYQAFYTSSTNNITIRNVNASYAIYGIYIASGHDVNVTNSYIVGTNNTAFVSTTSSNDVNVINVTLTDITGTKYLSATNSNFTVKWPININVTDDSFTPLNGRTVKAYNKLGDHSWTATTGADGLTGFINTTQILVNASYTTGFSLTDYNFTADGGGGYDWNFSINNFSTQRIIVLVSPTSVVPYITILEPENITYGTLTLDIDASATDFTPHSWWYSLNSGANTTFTPGVSQITAQYGGNALIVWANDTGTGEEYNDTVGFTVVTNISIQYPVSKTYKDNQRTINASETGFTAQGWWYSINDGTNTTFSPPQAFTFENGTNSLEVFANDTNGHNYSDTVSFVINNNITITSPTNSSYGTDQITVNATDNGFSADTWWYSLNGGLNTTFTPPHIITAQNGGNYLIVWANDSFNKVHMDDVGFTVSANLTIQYPVNKTYGKNSITLNASAGGFTPHTWWYVLNGGSNVTFTPDTTFTAPVGGNYLVVYSNDSTSGAVYSNNVGFTVDINITLLSPTNTSYGTNQINVNATANGFTAQGWWYSLNGGTNTTFTPPETISASGGGNHIYVFANDTFGHNYSADVGFTVTSNISIHSPLNQTYYTGVILLNTSASGFTPDVWWYSLNGGTNTTFTPPSTINAISGGNVLVVYANETGTGTVYNNQVGFTVDYYHTPTEAYNKTIFETATAWFYLRINVTNQSAIATVNASITWNGTQYAYTGFTNTDGYYVFRRAIPIPLIDVNSKNVSFHWNYSLSYTAGGMDNGSTTNKSQTIYAIQLLDCNGVGVETLHFWLYNEENVTERIKADFKATFHIWSGNDTSLNKSFAFDYNGSNNYSICIYPTNITIYTDAIVQYANETLDWAMRHYYFDNAALTNVTQNISLYLLNYSHASLITFGVINNHGEEQQDVVINIQKFYVGENVYRTVAMVKTSFDGTDITFLRKYYAWYKFILSKDGVVLNSYDPIQLSEDEYTFTLTPTGTGDWYYYSNNIATECHWNNVTTVLSCTALDMSGMMHQFCLEVNKLGLLSKETICNTCEFNNGATLLCNVTEDSYGNAFQYDLFVYAGSDKVSMYHGSLDLTYPVGLFGINGVLAALLIVLTLSMLGIFKPEISIIFGTFGLVISMVMGLIALSIGALSGLIIVVAILLYQMRGRYG